MSKSTGDNTKKRAPETGTLVGVRFQAGPLAQIDEWRSGQGDLPSRPEAVRRLVEKALLSG
ncbi:hypothetical protein FOM92_00610 [Sphingorhabdus contaminans]|uniref:Ribbon-helix-helix protein, CopG family n=1 Tax=Sphingorhabdus contaminans TaxID=1343899 RepID=A0A553WH17_9SPHN|nr:hypothetical protein FOM92_00610 [Sphingorhabdus contaminans]